MLHTREYVSENMNSNYLKSVITDDSDISLPVIAKLNKMFSLHLQKYCFSSIGVLLKRQLDLDVEKVIERIVTKKKGGYCFEHNLVFEQCLQFLDFEYTPRIARVLNNKNVENPLTPKTHKINIVKNGRHEYVVDVGFGANGPKCAIKNTSDVTIGPWGEKYRVVQNKRSENILQVYKEGGFYSLYSYDNGFYSGHDIEMSHWFSYTHPTAGFVNNLVVAKLDNDRVYSLRNNLFKIIISDGTERNFIIETENMLDDILRKYFGIYEDSKSIEYLFRNYISTHK